MQNTQFLSMSTTTWSLDRSGVVMQKHRLPGLDICTLSSEVFRVALLSRVSSVCYAASPHNPHEAAVRNHILKQSSLFPGRGDELIKTDEEQRQSIDSVAGHSQHVPPRPSNTHTHTHTQIRGAGRSERGRGWDWSRGWERRR